MALTHENVHKHAYLCFILWQLLIVSRSDTKFSHLRTGDNELAKEQQEGCKLTLWRLTLGLSILKITFSL